MSGTNHDAGEDEVQKEYREPVRCRWHNRAAGASEERSQLKPAAHVRKGSIAAVYLCPAFLEG